MTKQELFLSCMGNLGEIYDKIYQKGKLKYEVERFTDDGDCEIMYYR